MEKTDFAWAKNEAEPAMREILKHELGMAIDPDREVISGGYEQAIEYARVERQKYVAEVGKRDGNYIYHFWPRTEDLLPTFGEKLGDAMIKVFKFPERISAKHDEIFRCYEGEKGAVSSTPLCRFWGAPDEFLPTGGPGEQRICPNCHSPNVGISMSSWAVRVTGYADNPLADELAGSVFDVLDKLL